MNLKLIKLFSIFIILLISYVSYGGNHKYIGFEIHQKASLKSSTNQLTKKIIRNVLFGIKTISFSQEELDCEEIVDFEELSEVNSLSTAYVSKENIVITQVYNILTTPFFGTNFHDKIYLDTCFPPPQRYEIIILF